MLAVPRYIDHSGGSRSCHNGMPPLLGRRTALQDGKTRNVLFKKDLRSEDLRLAQWLHL